MKKKELINEYESELDKLNYKHNQKVKEISNELNNKGISINEYKQIIQELKNKLNNKKISLDEYKKRLNTLNDTHEKEIQKLKEEF